MNQCSSQDGFRIKTIDGKVKSGYIIKPKRTLQIDFKHGFFDAALIIHEIPIWINRHKVKMINKRKLGYGITSDLHTLDNFDDFNNDKTHLQ